MGTKRHMADHVRAAILEIAPSGQVVDLFSGMGSVAESLADLLPVATNDAAGFASAISRARFLGEPRDRSPRAVIERLEPIYRNRLATLKTLFAAQLAAEAHALTNLDTLATYMTRARHVGNDPSTRAMAAACATTMSESRYSLASLYFSAGYLSLQQAIEVDALRAALEMSDLRGEPGYYDWAIAAWLRAVSLVLNAPGHTAQYLRPNSDAAFKRITRSWQRSIWGEFATALEFVDQVGSIEWRAKNTVHNSDALDLVAGNELSHVAAVYADPPYTKDQYSRFYHVYETLYRYDFPQSIGAGRARPDRFATAFSLKSAVQSAFHDLCRNVSRLNLPLVLSYPDNGLLNQTGSRVDAITAKYFATTSVVQVPTLHSTLGASRGSSTKNATENLYVCN